MTLTADRLKELLDYDPETGVFLWKIKRKGTRRDKKAGSPDKEGYLTVVINGKRYRLHRLAWLYMTGHWPENDIDHRNNCRSDNRFNNLRPATRSQNIRNQPAKGRSRLKGVYYHTKNKNWIAQINLNGTTKHLGVFETPEAASNAYMKISLKTFGEFARAS